MFEALSGSSQSKNPRRPIAVLTALGLHAAVIAGFLFASVTTTAIVEPPAPLIRQPIFVDRLRGQGPEGRGGKKPGPPPPSNSTRRHPTHMKPPREMMAEQTPPDPIAPEPIAAPAAVASSNDSEPNPSNALSGSGSGGAGDAGGPNGEGAGAACPAGATCSVAGGEQILSMNNALTRPQARCTPPAPSAPYAARELGLDGRVVAQFIIHADGRADSVRVLNDDAPPMFAQAVRDWIEQCGFAPAQLNGAPYSVRMTQVFRFQSK